MTWHKARSISSGLSPQLLVNSGLYTQPQKPHPHSPHGPPSQHPQHSPSHPPQSPSQAAPLQPQPHSPSQGVDRQGLSSLSQPQTSATGYSGPHPSQGVVEHQQGSNSSQGGSSHPHAPNPFHDVASMPAQPGSSYSGLQPLAYIPSNPSGTSLDPQSNPSPPSLPSGSQQQGFSHSSSLPGGTAQGTGENLHADRSVGSRGEGFGYPIGASSMMTQGQSAQASTSSMSQPHHLQESHGQQPSHDNRGVDSGNTGFGEDPTRSATSQGDVASGSGQMGTELPERRPELPPGVTERPQLGKLSPPTRNYSFLAGGMKSEPSSHKLSALEERHATGMPVTADEAFNRALQVSRQASLCFYMLAYVNGRYMLSYTSGRYM